MNTAVKKILLTGSALVAVSFATAGIAQAQQTIGAGQTTEIDNSGLVTLDAANAMGTLADGASLTHNVVATTTGQGTFRTLGNATGITGTIGVGGGGPIAAVSIHGGTGTTAVFNGAVNANSLDFSGAGSATFNAATTITGPIAMLASHTLTTGDGLFTATGGTRARVTLLWLVQAA